MYQEPILRERLEEMKVKNNELYAVIEQFTEKYAQYGDLFTPLLETHSINAQIWSESIYLKYFNILI